MKRRSVLVLFFLLVYVSSGALLAVQAVGLVASPPDPVEMEAIPIERDRHAASPIQAGAVPSQTVILSPPDTSPSAPGSGPAIQRIRPGDPDLVPIIYQFMDWGTDFQTTHPEYGPIGSIQFAMWEDVNPGPGSYNWNAMEKNLAKERNLKVTLLDGTVIPKPVVTQIMTHLSSYPDWEGADFYDGTPQWVYDQIDRENPNNPRPIVNGRKVGYVVQGCDKIAVLPMWDNKTWQKAHLDTVRAFGARYGQDAMLTAIMIATGLDGETQPIKNWYCEWDSYMDQQLPSTVRSGFIDFVLRCMDAYREAFPNKPIFIMNAPGESQRKTTSDYAASFSPPIGLKHCGMTTDLDSHQGYGKYVGSWDMVRTYSMTVPIFAESPFGFGSDETKYWSWLAGLHYHPDSIDVHPDYLPQTSPEMLKWISSHLHRTVQDTPSVWTVLRDYEYEKKTWGDGGASGKMGDWCFWLTREDEQEGKTVRLWREELPADARDHMYSRQARRTDQASGNKYMYFDVDNGYPYVSKIPADQANGQVSFKVKLVFMNQGTDTLALQYRNYQGQWVSKTLRKGPSLGTINTWATQTFQISDAYFNNNVGSRSDFRISCEGDGDEIVHLVEVIGEWAPTFRPTSTPTLTPTPLTSPRTFSPQADTFITEWYPTTNYDASTTLILRQGGISRPLLQFDLSSLARTTRIRDAKLRVYVPRKSNASSLQAYAYKVLRDWTSSQATWKQASNDRPWGADGCNAVGSDREGTASSQVMMSIEERWYTFDISQMVREWIADPSSNHGVIILAESAASVQYELASKESGTGTAPQLVVNVELDASTTLTPTWTPSRTPTPTRTSTPTVTATASQTATAGPSPTPTITPTPSDTPVGPPTPTPSSTPNPGYRYPQADTYLDSWYPTTNYGTLPLMNVRQGDVMASLLKFDLADLAGREIRSAQLEVYALERTNTGSLEARAYRVRRPWQEREATWQEASRGVKWATAGCNAAGTDRDADPFYTFTLSETGRWYPLDVTELVRSWLADPQSNQGLVIRGNGTVSVEYRLVSVDGPDPALWPRLSLDLVPGPAATATPTRTATATPTYAPRPTVQPGSQTIAMAADTYVDRREETQVHGTSATLGLSTDDVSAALFRADLGAIPTGSQVLSAKLHLYVKSSSSGALLSAILYKLLRAWNENEASWLQATRDSTWYEPGCNGPGIDRSGESTAQINLERTNYWISFDITDLVRQWIADPASNHGVVIKGSSTVYVTYDLASREFPVESARPWLEIVFPSAATSTPTITPMPSNTPLPSPTPTPSSTPNPAYRYPKGDTYMESWYPTINYGKRPLINVRQDDVMASLLKFDLADLAGREIRSARLELYVLERTNTGSLEGRAYRVRRPWQEQEATWQEASRGVPWATVGCNGIGTDRDGDPVYTFILNETGRWYPLDITELVRSWLADPQTNHGLVIRGYGTVSVEYRFVSVDGSDPALWPRLSIDLVAGPTPTTTPTRTATATLMPTVTATTVPPTATLTKTSTPSPTTTQTLTATATSTPTATASPSPSATASATTVPTPTNTPTATALPTATATRTPTASATAVPTPTNTPTATALPTATATRTPTASATATPSVTPTMTPSATATRTATPSATSTATASQTPIPTVTFTPGPTAQATEIILAVVADAALNGQSVDSNHGYSGSLPLRTMGSKSPVLRFSLAEIPAGAIVQRAILRGRTIGAEKAGLRVDVIGLRRPWIESEVTWNVADIGTPWALGGAQDTILDRLDTVAGSTTVSGGESWWAWDIPSLVQDWVNGQQGNYGVILTCTDTSLYAEIAFASREYGAPAQLVVRYSVGGGQTPTPTQSPVASATTTPSATRTWTPTPSPSHTVTATATRTALPTPTSTPSGTLTPIPPPTDTPEPYPMSRR